MTTSSVPSEMEAIEIRDSLARNLERIEEDIAAACRSANRTRSEVELIAVSKMHPAATILAAVELGLHSFGENRVQEFGGKSIELGSARQQVQAHLIGHLQSNKAAKAVEIFDAIDSLDSAKLAERLNDAAATSGKRLPVLVEIKLSEEETKAGLDPDSVELEKLLDRLPSLKNLEMRGLMTIAPFGVATDVTQQCFRSLRVLRDRIAQAHPQLSLPVLSMGMSGDFGLAIAEGATRIRIGTALFGSRNSV